MNVRDIFEKRIKKYEELLIKENKVIKVISMLRFFLFVFFLLISIYFYKLKLYYYVVASVAIFVILFVFLVLKHLEEKWNKSYLENIIKLNKNSIIRLEGNWREFTDSGEEFIDKNHSYSYDLDIFGKGSLFQYINSSVTYNGRKRLKEILEAPLFSKEELYKRQEAVLELSKNIGFRQRLTALGMNKEKIKSSYELTGWAESECEIKINSSLKILFILIPVIFLTVLMLSIITKKIPYNIPILMFIIQFFILKINEKKVNNELNSVFKYKDEVEVYKFMIKLLEKKKFKSSYINSIKKNMIDKEDKGSTFALEELSKLSNSIMDRNNFFYIIFNSIFFYDYILIEKLNHWKKQFGFKFKDYIEALGEIEALCSLAQLSFGTDEYVMPSFEEDKLFLKGEEVGHPLIVSKAVKNHINIENEKIILITGSNMSGKSTYLRTCGINLILAFSGAAVFAKSFKCSRMNVKSCMRTSDNLEGNISSFYAELLRIKNIVSSLEKKENIFFLLDEIFKGTNSIDRHTGASVLIKRLLKENAIGLVSTHDLELAYLEKEFKEIKNYHFEENYYNGNIQFDYKLRKGVSNTRNATFLMKLVGIDME